MSDQDNVYKKDMENKLGVVEVPPPSRPPTKKDKKIVKLNPNQKLYEEAEPYDLLTIDQLEVNRSSDYLIKGILDRNSTSLWYGSFSNGKTFLMFDMAYRVSLGLNWNGLRTKACKTMYVALEGLGAIQKRAVAMREMYQEEHGISENFFLFKDFITFVNGTNEINHGDIARLIKTINDNDIELIVVDTLSVAISTADENGMGATSYNHAIRLIKDETNCHIATIHHSGWSNKDRIRGNSALAMNTDYMGLIEKPEDSNIISTTMKKTRDSDKVGETFYNKLEVYDMGTDDEGDQITTCVIKPCSPDDIQAQKKVKKGKNGLTPKQQIFHNHLVTIFTSVPRSEMAFQKGNQILPRTYVAQKLVEMDFFEGFAHTDPTKYAQNPDSQQVLGDKERSSLRTYVNALESRGLWGKGEGIIKAINKDVDENGQEPKEPPPF